MLKRKLLNNEKAYEIGNVSKQNHYCKENQKLNFIDKLIEMYTKTVM